MICSRLNSKSVELTLNLSHAQVKNVSVTPRKQHTKTEGLHCCLLWCSDTHNRPVFKFRAIVLLGIINWTGTQCNSHVLTDTESPDSSRVSSCQRWTNTPCAWTIICFTALPVKDSRFNILVKPEISSDQEDEIEVFDMHTSSGECCYLY